MKSSAVEDIVGSVAEQNITLSLDRLTPVEVGIVQVLAYADVFDYALTLSELYRFLPLPSTSPNEIRVAIDSSKVLIPKYIEQHGQFYTLAGRGVTASIRRRRAAIAAELWPSAYYYSHIIARLPFVRMIAVTGALAVDNVDSEGDIDFLIITQAGRLWLCRALVIGIVKFARWRGVEICPNYFLSERALVLEDRNLFSAHEFAQMVLLADHGVYARMRKVNPWITSYLPNRGDVVLRHEIEATSGYWLKTALETLFNTRLGSILENWEMRRKLRRFLVHGGTETLFNPDCCKGHFEPHGQQILSAYDVRLRHP